MEEHQSIKGKFFFAHMEVGFSKARGEPIIPDPEWSSPSNNRALDEVEAKILPMVFERTMCKVLQILEQNKARGMFLAFPYFAEKHRDALRDAVSHNHVVSIHMHENWKYLSSNMSIEKLTEYIKSEKTRLEKMVGIEVSIFSHGPGIQLDNMWGKENPPNYGSLTDGEKRKMFQSVKNAGFEFIQTAREYQVFMPSGLRLLSYYTELIGLPHSFEWHTQKEELREVIDSISDKTR
jgi:hypothetical protein